MLRSTNRSNPAKPSALSKSQAFSPGIGPRWKYKLGGSSVAEFRYRVAMMVSPSVKATLIEFACPLFALIMIHIALNTAFSSVFGSICSYTFGSSFKINEKKQFAIRRAAHLVKQFIPQMRQQPATNRLKIRHITIMHKHISPTHEWMTIILMHARPRPRGAHVSKQQRGVERLAQRTQISIMRRRTHRRIHPRATIRIQTMFIHHTTSLRSVPADTTPVHVHLVVPLGVARAPGRPPGAVRHRG
mmetsp:Transcript_3757/g.12620  ORF Transcript_3757/g.12620 Transcript_3757/m.12620 type:complete len:245 (-) Transcript_3757:126-860(-)